MKQARSIPPITDRLAALGESVRLRVLRLLEREELAVGEVAKVLQMPQSTVSRHLKVLADAQWVRKRTEGTATYYRLVLEDLHEPSRALWLAVREHTGADQAEDLRRLAAVLAERREDSQAYFGRVAGQWDDVRSELFGSLFTHRALLSLLPRDWTVLDMGCGTGNAAELLAPMVQRVIALDQSAAMLGAARKRLKGVTNVDFVTADLTHPPTALPASCVDAAVCVLVLHHIEKPVVVLEESRRLLRQGAPLLIVDMISHDRDSYRQTMGHRWQGFTRQQIETLAKDAGLVEPRYVSLPSDADARGPGLFALTVHKP